MGPKRDRAAAHSRCNWPCGDCRRRCEFPPLRTAAELQQSLGEGEALVVFHAAADNLYGFLVTKTDSRTSGNFPTRADCEPAWRIFSKRLGNYGANRQLSIAELKSDAWREAVEGSLRDDLRGCAVGPHQNDEPHHRARRLAVVFAVRGC